MRNDIRQAVDEVKKQDQEFHADTAWETDDYIVLIDEQEGIPPYIVNRKNFSVRIIRWGDKKDMDIAYKDSVFVERIK